MAGRDIGEDLFGTPAPQAEAPDLGAELFGAPAAPAPRVAKPTTSVPNPFKEPAPAQDFQTTDPMGGDLGAAIMDQAETPLGVMKNAPKGEPQKTAFLPIRPEVRQAHIAEYNAASP